MTVEPAAITGLILAGGRGTRMGHVDKGLQAFRNEALIAHAIRRLAPQVGTLALNVNRNQALYQAFGLPLWPDLLPDFAGPLAGLQSGLQHCRTPYLLCVPCDSPCFPHDLALRLAQALSAGSADLAFAVTGAADDTDNDAAGNGGKRQRHPVFCLLKTTLLPKLNAYLHDGGRKMDGWMRMQANIEVDFDDAAAFSNLNTWDELRQYDADQTDAHP